MKKILLLTTGGTIASEEGAEGLEPKTTGQQILGMMPDLHGQCEAECINLLNLDSTNMQPEEWITMAQAVFDNAPRYDGIVITHGTDTMAYSAAALSNMLLNLQIPVVLTGSQLPVKAENTDALENLQEAFVTTMQAPAGVYIAFGGKVIEGAWATKIRTAGFGAFVTVNRPYAGKFQSGKLVLHPDLKSTQQGEPALDTRLDTKVILFKLIPGFEPQLLLTAPKMGYHGIVLESFGPGGLPYYRRNLVPAVQEIIEAGTTVAITTQCRFEGCDLTHYAVGIKALKTGLIPGGDFTTENLVVRMMLGLGRHYSPAEMKSYLTGPKKNFARDVPLCDLIE